MCGPIAYYKGNRTLKKWIQMLGCLIGGICLYVFLAYFFHWDITRSLLSTARTFPVCWSICFFFITLLLRAVKWTFILRRRDYVTWRTGYDTVMISNVVNYVFPIRLGEVLKLYIIKKAANVPYPSSVSATLIDRFSQLLVMLLFLFFTPAAGFVFSDWSSKFIVILVLCLLLSISLFILGPRLLDIFSDPLRNILLSLRVDQDKLKRLSEAKVISLCRETLQKINILEFSKWNLVIILLLSVIIVSVDGICYYFIIKAFGISITWLQGALAACLMNLMFILPTPPAQVGTAEMYPVLIFSWGLGLPSSVISSAAILWHLLTSVLFVVLGLLSAVILGVGFGNIFRIVRQLQEGRVGEGEEYQSEI